MEEIKNDEIVNNENNENNEKEIKGKLNSKKPIIIVLVAIFAIILIGAGLWYFVFRNKDIVIPNLAITASEMDNYETLLTSKFNVKADVPTDKEYLTKAITIEPAIEYDISQISELDYQIIPKVDLKSNTIYNVTYLNEETKYKWSFQTENVYKISTMYPADGYTETEVNTVVEMDFSYIPKDNIEEYFEIKPNVDGTFQISDRRIKFIPTNPLAYATKYEITIKKGFENKENTDTLQEDLHYTFYTKAVEDNVSKYYFENLISYRTDETIRFVSRYSYRANEITSGNVKIYQYNQSSDFENGIEKQSGFGLNSAALVKIDTTKMVLISEKDINSISVKNEENVVIDLNEKLSEGYYLAVLDINNIKYYINIQVTNLMAYYAIMDGKEVVWVLTSNNEQIVEGADIYVNDKHIGLTNEQGYLLTDKEIIKENRTVKVRYSDYPVLYLFLDSNYYDDYSEYEQELSQTTNEYIFTDRKAYKSGEKVKVWGFVKDRDNAKYDKVSLEVMASGYADYSMESIPLSIDEYGCYNTEIDLSNYDNNTYYIRVISNGTVISWAYFDVLQYNINSFDIELSSDKEVVFSGEPIQLNLVVKLYDGTPVANQEFEYTYGDSDNVIGKIKTDINGRGTAKIDTSYLTPYSDYMYKYITIQGAGIEINEQRPSINVCVLPKLENYEVIGEYNNETNSYTFTANTYMYDKSVGRADRYAGKGTSRKVTVKVQKYHRVKVLSNSYYDENTKTMKDVYKTESRYLGEDIIQIDTVNGKGSITYPNMLNEYEDPYIKFTTELEMADGTTVINHSYESFAYDNGNYNDDYIYELQNDYFKTYKINEKIELNVEKGEEQLTKPCNIMYLIKSAKGLEIKITNNPKDSIKFEKEYGANVSIKGCIYENGRFAFMGYSRYANYSYTLDKTEMTVDMSISFDKTSYRPGDKAVMTVDTKYKGSPVQTEVNVCAVDQAFLDIYDYNYDIVGSMYNYYSFRDYSGTISHYKDIDYAGGGEGGGGEGRSDFATTAIFETIKTDENGKATIEITWPDNITSWNVLTQCVTKEFEAGIIEKNVSVTLPYFVTPVYKGQYLVGETPRIPIRSDGTAVKTGYQATYSIEVTNPDGQKVTETLNSKVGEYAQYLMPELKEGKYQLKVSGKCGDYTDTVIHDINVVKTLLKTKQVNDYPLTKGQNIQLSGNIGKMYFINTTTENILDELFYLSSLPQLRNDQKVVANIANERLKELSDGDYSYKIDSPIFTYGINIIQSAETDVSLTARILSTGYTDINKSSMIEYLENVINQDDSSKPYSRDTLFAYWGLASLKSPVLAKLKQANSTLTPEDVFEKTLLGLAFADIGDYDSANECFNQIKDKIKTDNKEVYCYSTILAMKLNKDERKAMYDEYLTLDTETEFSNFVKLAYVQNEILKNVEKASITLEINGEKEQIDLSNIGTTIKTFEKTDNVKIVKLTKNVRAKIEQYKPVDKSKSKYLLNREYLVNGKQVTSFKVGDTVTNRIYIDYYSIGSDNKYLCVEEVIPNCMTYLPQISWYNYDKNVVNIPSNIDGQKITFPIYKRDGYVPYIEYLTRVVSNGNYVTDGAILKSHSNTILDYSSFGNITVR